MMPSLFTRIDYYLLSRIFNVFITRFVEDPLTIGVNIDFFILKLIVVGLDINEVLKRGS